MSRPAAPAWRRPPHPRARIHAHRQRSRRAAAALLSAKLIKDATLKVYPGYDHGMCSTHKDVINADLLAFCKGERAASA